MAKPEDSSTSSHSSGGGNAASTHINGGVGANVIGMGVSGISGPISKQSVTVKSSSGNTSDTLDTTRAHNRKEKERMRKQLRENAQRLQLLEQQMQSLSSEVACSKSTSPSPKQQLQTKGPTEDIDQNNNYLACIHPKPTKQPQCSSEKQPHIVTAADISNTTTSTVTSNPQAIESSAPTLHQQLQHTVQHHSRTTSNCNNSLVKKLGDSKQSLKQQHLKYYHHLHSQSLSQHQLSLQHTIQRPTERNITIGSLPTTHLDQPIQHFHQSHSQPTMVHELHEISPVQQNILISPGSSDGFVVLPDALQSNNNYNHTNNDNNSSTNNNDFSMDELSANPSFSIESINNPVQFPPIQISSSQQNQQPQPRLPQQQQLHHHSFPPLPISNLDSMNVNHVSNTQHPIAPNSGHRPSWFGVPF